MLRCIKYECRKLFGHPIISILWVVLLVLNSVGLTVNETTQQSVWFENRSLAADIEAQYSVLPPQDAAEQLKEWCSHNELMAYASWSRDGAPRDEARTQLALLLEMYPDLPDLMEEIDPVYYYDTYSIYSDLYSRYQWLDEYPAYLQQVQRQAEQMQATTLFSTENTFSLRNSQKTAQDFAACTRICLRVGNDRFLAAVNHWRGADVLALVLLLMVAFFLFLEEQENEVFRLVRATPNGRTTTAAAKLTTGCLSAVAIATTFSAGTMLTAGVLYGAPDWRRSVQSIRSFRGCTLFLTEGSYLVCFLMQKLLAFLAVTLLIACLVAFLKSSKLVCVAGVLVAAAEAGFYVFLHPASVGNVLKYLNLLFLLDPATVFTEYVNLNFFGYALSVRPVLYGACGVFFLLLGGFFLYQYARPAPLSLPALPGAVRGVTLQLPTLKTTGLFWQESRRMLISSRGILVWVLAVALVLGWCCQLPLVRLDYNQSVYRYYLRQVEGSLTEEQTDTIEAWDRMFDSISLQAQALQEQFENGQITTEEYKAQTVALEALSQQSKGFQLLYSQYERVRLLEAQGLQPALIDTISEEYLLNNPTRDLVSGGGMLLLLVLLVQPVAGEDTALSRLHSTTVNGRKLWRLRVIIVLVFSFVFVVLKWIPVLWDMMRQYPIASWNAAIQSLQTYMNCTARLTILQLLVFWIAAQILSCAFYTLAFFSITKWLGRPSLSLPANILILFSGLAALLLPTDVLHFINPTGAFLTPGAIILENIPAYLVIQLFLTVLTLLCALKVPHARNHLP